MLGGNCQRHSWRAGLMQPVYYLVLQDLVVEVDGSSLVFLLSSKTSGRPSPVRMHTMLGIAACMGTEGRLWWEGGMGKGGEAGKNFLGSISGHWEKVPQEVGQPGERGGREDGREAGKAEGGHCRASPSTHSLRTARCGQWREWGLPTSAGDSPGGGLGDRAERGRTGEAVFSYFQKPQEPVLAWPLPVGVVSLK